MEVSKSLPSERKFGLFFAAIFILLSIYARYKHFQMLWISVFILAAVVLFIVSFVVPRLLAPLNNAWLQIGQLMGKVASPIVLGVIFFLCIAPVALIQRLTGRDVLEQG